MPGGALEIGHRRRPIPAHVHRGDRHQEPSARRRRRPQAVRHRPALRRRRGHHARRREVADLRAGGVGAERRRIHVRAGGAGERLAVGRQARAARFRHRCRRRAARACRNTSTRLEVRAIAELSRRRHAPSPSRRPSQFEHPGTTDENGDGRPDYLPHVANLTRNVVIRSENRTGTRGHVLLHGPRGRRHPLRRVRGPRSDDVRRPQPHDQSHRPLLACTCTT